MIVPFLKPVTVWERYTKQSNGEWAWEHNHLEEGHSPRDMPIPIHEDHKKSWNGARWRKSFQYLNEENVVV